MASPEPTSADSVPEARPVNAPRLVPVWDPAVRMFHWLLVGLVGINLYTGNVGGVAEMEWHVRCGCAILALVLFRIGWGLIGPPTARFTDFVRGPAAVLAYARSLLRTVYQASVGHNPLGGW
jgi:cytochrome b